MHKHGPFHVDVISTFYYNTTENNLSKRISVRMNRQQYLQLCSASLSFLQVLSFELQQAAVFSSKKLQRRSLKYSNEDSVHSRNP